MATIKELGTDRLSEIVKNELTIFEDWGISIMDGSIEYNRLISALEHMSKQGIEKRIQLLDTNPKEEVVLTHTNNERETYTFNIRNTIFTSIRNGAERVANLYITPYRGDKKEVLRFVYTKSH